jgi:hypothetical protein
MSFTSDNDLATETHPKIQKEDLGESPSDDCDLTKLFIATAQCNNAKHDSDGECCKNARSLRRWNYINSVKQDHGHTLESFSSLSDSQQDIIYRNAGFAYVGFAEALPGLMLAHTDLYTVQPASSSASDAMEIKECSALSGAKIE